MAARVVALFGFVGSGIAACGDRAADPCEAMCTAAATLYGGCLEDWGADWTAAGYGDDAEFIDACQTWAWQMRLLEEHEGSALGWTDQTCRARTTLYDEGVCTDFTQTDWNQMPWGATPEPEKENE